MSVRNKRIIVTIFVLCAIYILAFYILPMSCNALTNLVEKTIINNLKDNYLPVAYREQVIDQKSLQEYLIEGVGRTCFYYEYLEKENKKIELVVYDPNKIGVKKEESPTVDAAEMTSAESEEETVAVSTAHDSLISLYGEGIGLNYSMEQLSDFNFLLSNFYVVPERASVLESDLNAAELLSMDWTLEKDSSKPQILIYHTHSQEGFSNSVAGDPNTSIVAVGTYLSEILSEVYGYNVIHCTETFDYVDGKLDRSLAYTYARETILQILADNPSIQVILDIHRDGVGEDVHLVTQVNGKDTSQIMFFNGVSRSSAVGDIDYLYNKYRSANLSFSLQLKLLAEQYFPGFTRKNYIDAYQYNLDLRERSVLVEVGAQNNTLEQAKNAMEPLAALINRILQGDGSI